MTRYKRAAMTISDIKDVKRKDTPIYYRMIYTGTAVIEMAGKTSSLPIDFTIETKPTGLKDIIITFNDTPDYPVIPLKKELKTKIEELDTTGKLPI
jgi:hypothetical protein